jgi:hypothetical protein
MRPASPRTALVVGVSVLVLLVGATPLLVVSAHQWGATIVAGPVFLLSFVIVGVVVARRQPGNPVGWVMLGVAVSQIVLADARSYAVVAYVHRDARSPLGPIAVWLAGSIAETLFLLLPLAILLFPDGNLSRRWRWVLRVYLALAAVYEVAALAGEGARIFGHHIEVDAKGQFIAPEHLSGLAARLAAIEGPLTWILLQVFLLFWLAFVGRQLVSYRRSTGERREQLKWLMSGGAVSVVGLMILYLASAGNSAPSLGRQAVEVTGLLMSVALPVGIGVGILKYRLYEIDRLISRTLSYAILTGLLVGVFVGIVVLATDVLPFSSPVAVAASTLAAAALFNPLRLQVQRLVDRRFNRARYDAEAIIAAFNLRLRGAVDLDTVRSELLSAVNGAVQPAHASVWLRPPG